MEYAVGKLGVVARRHDTERQGQNWRNRARRNKRRRQCKDEKAEQRPLASFFGITTQERKANILSTNTWQSAFAVDGKGAGQAKFNDYDRMIISKSFEIGLIMSFISCPVGRPFVTSCRRPWRRLDAKSQIHLDIENVYG